MCAPAKPRRAQTPLVPNVDRTVLVAVELPVPLRTGHEFPTHLRVEASMGAHARVEENAAEPDHADAARTSDTDVKRAVAGLRHRYEVSVRRDRLMQDTGAGFAGLRTGNAARPHRSGAAA